MSKLRFTLRVFGGPAERHRVDFRTVSRLLYGVAQDVEDVCRNIAHEDKGASWDEKLESCRLYMIPEVKPSSSLVPCETEDSDLAWGRKSLIAYVRGVSALRASQGEDDDLPEGLDYSILKRLSRYYDVVQPQYDGFAIDVFDNGAPTSIVFDVSLRQALEIHLGRFQRKERLLAGFTIQGVLYEVSDQYYDDPTSHIKVEVDPHDGTRWVCTVPRDLLEKPLDEYFRKTVIMQGDAKFRPKKPELAVSAMRVLEGLQLEEALGRFLAVNKGVWDDVDASDYMKRIRERD